MSDILHITAQPHDVLDAQSVTLDDQIRTLATEGEVTDIVVGLPTSLSGNEGPSADGARALAARCGEATGLPIHLSDERFTTKTATEALISANVRRADRKKVVDKVAAAVMLQQWLDSRS